MEDLRFKEFFEGVKTDYASLKTTSYKDIDHKNALINSLALRILGSILMVAAATLIITGVGLLSLASLGCLPTLIVAATAGILGYDCLVIGHNQSQIIKQFAPVQESQDPKAPIALTIWDAFRHPLVYAGLSSSATPATALPSLSAQVGRQDLEGTLVIKHLYNMINKPS